MGVGHRIRLPNFGQETQLSLTNRATHLCKRNGVTDFLKHAPSRHSICVTMSEFGRSAPKDVGMNTEDYENHKTSGALELKLGQQRPRSRIASRGKNRWRNEPSDS